MQRLAFKYLKNWRVKPDRKPLIIRGARQVGKTHGVRQLGGGFRYFVEINLEQMPEAKQVFHKDLVPERIARDLSLLVNKPIIPGETLLFLDEIQAEPQAISALRYFYEQMPNLHVIAAGSLLDFVLENIGVPVGRVEFMYMYPMSFIEFLMAKGLTMLAEAILDYHITKPFIEPIHNQLLGYLGEYFAVGGMPEAVKTWIEKEDLPLCSQIHHQITEAYRQDFLKYAKNLQIKYMDLLFERVPFFLGQKFKYSNIGDHYRKRELAPCLELLIKAGVVRCVYHTAAQGLPLGAQVDFEKFKTIFLDVALAQAVLGLKTQNWILQAKEMIVNRGGITEAFVGQEMLAYSPNNTQNTLYYWQREARSSNAEIDYVADINREIIPIEVKSDKRGGLKSLHLFLAEHPNVPYAIKFSTHQGSIVEKIHAYPLYAIASLFVQKEMYV